MEVSDIETWPAKHAPSHSPRSKRFQTCSQVSTLYWFRVVGLQSSQKMVTFCLIKRPFFDLFWLFFHTSEPLMTQKLTLFLFSKFFCAFKVVWSHCSAFPWVPGSWFYQPPPGHGTRHVRDLADLQIERKIDFSGNESRGVQRPCFERSLVQYLTNVQGASSFG